MICLDTILVIAFLKGEPKHLVERVEREMLQGTFALPAVTLFELRYGIAKSPRRRENDERLVIFLQLPITVLPFEPEDAEEAAHIRAGLERVGTPIGAYDVLIAGQARRRGAVLVTANMGESARVPGLETEDWAAA
jgi:tRNA(fMet)-specific endonuclease VapC